MKIHHLVELLVMGFGAIFFIKLVGGFLILGVILAVAALAFVIYIQWGEIRAVQK
jgi:hypothetical protein